MYNGDNFYKDKRFIDSVYRSIAELATAMEYAKKFWIDANTAAYKPLLDKHILF